MGTLGEIILGVLGGGSLVALITFFVQRKDAKNDKLKEILDEIKGFKEWQKKMEKDVVRTQMLILMANFTEADTSELLTCAEHYFKNLEGDWYMTSLFSRFLKDRGIPFPNWFREV